jgi:hypothetical protein
MRILLFFSVLFLVTTTTGLARDIYVDNEAGDNANSGISAEVFAGGNGPVQTISRALRMAKKGDRIVLAANETPYRESILLHGGKHSGFKGYPFIIEGNGAILDGSLPVPDNSWRHVQGEVFRFQPFFTSYQVLFQDSVPLPYLGKDAGLDTLKSGDWTLAKQAIHFRVHKDKLPQQYNLFFAAKRWGVVLEDVSHVEIRDLTVQGFQMDGILAEDNVFNCTLLGVMCRGNGRSGMAVTGASHVTLDQALLGNNLSAQLLTDDSSETRVINCDILPNTAPAIRMEGGRLFVDGQRVEKDWTPPQQ